MAKQRRSLNGKVVAITGGARGIGKATAAALVRRGCRVAIGDLDLALAEETAGSLGGGVVALLTRTALALAEVPHGRDEVLLFVRQLDHAAAL